MDEVSKIYSRQTIRSTKKGRCRSIASIKVTTISPYESSIVAINSLSLSRAYAMQKELQGQLEMFCNNVFKVSEKPRNIDICRRVST